MFEGPDGSGKSSLIKEISSWLDSLSVPILVTGEPGFTSFGKAIRFFLNQSVYKATYKVTPDAEFLLYASDRAQHISEIIFPAIKNNKFVISDRYIYSSIVYQHIVHGASIDLINAVHNVISKNILPDIIFYIEANPFLCFERICKKKEKDIFDEVAFSKIEAINNGYKKLFSNFILDSNNSNVKLHKISTDIFSLKDSLEIIKNLLIDYL